MKLTMTAEAALRGLRTLYPGINLLYEASVSHEPDGLYLLWWRPGPPPTEAELVAAAEQGVAREELRATLAEYQGLLDERYRLYTRAMANDNAQDAADIKDEIQMILAALQEVRDALALA